ncbi:MAG: hypothetical protein NTY20_04485 [Candidatus Aenigmarchaeota archaeon]|nr:hypothetical protein [Candidatus Aenigmarchaeota archaeon]
MNNPTRAESAEGIVENAYDLSSIGIGIQRQLVDYIVHNPEGIRNRGYLSDALISGTNSNLIAAASVEAEETFSPEGLASVKSALQSLRKNHKELEYKLWRRLAYDIPFKGSGQDYLEMQEALGILESLSRKGYFSKPPSKKAVEKFLRGWNTMGFGAALVKEDIEFDYEKMAGDVQEVMLHEGRNDSAGFHSHKLGSMVIITEQALEVLPSKMIGYRPEMPRWKDLFNEDVPPVRILLESSKKVIEEAMSFTGK